MTNLNNALNMLQYAQRRRKYHSYQPILNGAIEAGWRAGLQRGTFGGKACMT